MRSHRYPIPLTVWLLCLGLAAAAPAVEVDSDVPERVDDLVGLPVEAVKITDSIYKIEGQGAIYLVNTPEGSVLIDTGYDNDTSLRQKTIIDEIATRPIRKIIITHFHGDHMGGLKHWEAARAAGAEVIFHQRLKYMSRIQRELIPFFTRRYERIYPDQVDEDDLSVPYYWLIQPDREVYVGQDYVFTLGGVEFRVIAPNSTGEGEDGLLVWVPQSRALFVGDLFGALYPMLPNLYTVRGEKYRDPLDYIDTLNLVLDLEPQILGPTHFKVLTDPAYIRASVTKMRDAVQSMWDQTVAGMNEGKTVWELMEQVQLAPELQLSQGHGKLSWNVRGAWEIATGWYHYDSVANLYAVPPSAVNADIVDLAGGADRIAQRANAHLTEGRPLHALRLLDLTVGAETPLVLETRIATLEALLERARLLDNYSEIGLLESDLRDAQEKLGRESPAAASSRQSP